MITDTKKIAEEARIAKLFPDAYMLGRGGMSLRYVEMQYLEDELPEVKAEVVKAFENGRAARRKAERAKPSIFRRIYNRIMGNRKDTA